MSTILKNKNIVLGVCGGIAAYKSVELLRLLKKADARVRVIMTQSACEFVAPLTFKALSGEPVCTTLFEENDDAAIRHIEWAEKADAVVMAPATANTIAKLAHGIADDALSTFMLAVTSPKLICPSMNSAMYENQAVQRNIDILEGDGYSILEPGSGELACGTTGPGRLPEPEYILDRLIKLLSPKDLKGKQVLVTAGPTMEPIDPVRFISNHSSGKTGYAIARAAEHRGADVILVSGPANLQAPDNVTTVNVKTADEMYNAVFDHAKKSHIIIKVAAVADYKPETEEKQKIKKDTNDMGLLLKKNRDILQELGKRKNQILVGFAAETKDLEKNAKAKLSEKNLDMIVGNIVGTPDSGFNADTNQVTLFYKDGKKEELPVLTKDEIAHILLDRIVDMQRM